MAMRDYFLLNRLAFGANTADQARLAQLGLKAWVQEQLRPDDRADSACQQRLQALRARIKYPEGTREGKQWPALDEQRPLQWLNAPIDALWALHDRDKPVPQAEKNRPRIEVSLATLLRAVHSRWQLRELVCDFWHNHFSVNAGDTAIGIALPVYDREVIRTHALGNFRQLLEAVGKSTAMLWSLNNRSSRTGSPNENYARELFELHTLGRDAYLNAYYNRWRDVPGATEGKPVGYIDQDVYEAARAFTGWGLEDGSRLGGKQSLPNTGKFVYVESWHDNYQKRVLGNEFDPYQPPLKDGQKVLDLAAFHPATARYVCGKLCRRLLSDTPPESLVASASRVWIGYRDKPDQIARVIEHIVLSREFADNRDPKVKRPLELLASFLRALEVDFTPGEALINELEGAGQKLFGWPTPTGHPDNNEFWLGSNAMRRRWTLLAGLAENWWQSGAFDPFAAMPGKSSASWLDFWLTRLYGEAKPALRDLLLKNARLSPEAPLNNPTLARRLVAWAAMAPEFQSR